MKREPKNERGEGSSNVGARTRGITAGQKGGFQNPGVCLQAFPSIFPHPLPALLLAPFFAQSLTLVPRSLLLNRMETLATQAKQQLDWKRLLPRLFHVRDCAIIIRRGAEKLELSSKNLDSTSSPPPKQKKISSNPPLLC